MLNASLIYRLLVEDEMAQPIGQPSEEAPAPMPDVDQIEPDFDVVAYLGQPEKTIVEGGGPTELYAKFQRQLVGRNRKKINHNTCLEASPNAIRMRLYATDIITAHSDGRVVVDTNEHREVLTKDRLNMALDAGWGIFQLKNEWYWYNSVTGAGRADSEQGLLPYTDGDVIHASGSLHAQAYSIPSKRRKRAAA